MPAASCGCRDLAVAGRGWLSAWFCHGVPPASHIQDDVGVGLGAADQHLSDGGRLQRVGGVGYAAAEQGVVQVWQTPVRQLQRVGMSQASASSSTLRRSLAYGVAMPLRAKVTSGPVPGAPGG
jgi:hypothetical protein